MQILTVGINSDSWGDFHDHEDTRVSSSCRSARNGER